MSKANPSHCVRGWDPTPLMSKDLKYGTRQQTHPLMMEREPVSQKGA